MTQYFLSEFIVNSYAGTTPSESIFEAQTFRIHPFHSNTHECIKVIIVSGADPGFDEGGFG